MKGRLLLAALAALALALGGCADHRFIRDDDKDTNSTSLVFGYVDMEDAPCDLNWVTIRQVLPKTDKPFWHTAINNGMFWGSHFTAGAYQFDAFGGASGWRNAEYTFQLPRQENLGRFKATDKPGIYFLGSYKYVSVKTGFFEQGKFDFVPAKSPTERELLERLLAFTESKTWEARIRQRMAELKK